MNSVYERLICRDFSKRCHDHRLETGRYLSPLQVENIIEKLSKKWRNHCYPSTMRELLHWNVTTGTYQFDFNYPQVQGVI